MRIEPGPRDQQPDDRAAQLQITRPVAAPPLLRERVLGDMPELGDGLGREQCGSGLSKVTAAMSLLLRDLVVLADITDKVCNGPTTKTNNGDPGGVVRVLISTLTTV